MDILNMYFSNFRFDFKVTTEEMKQIQDEDFGGNMQYPEKFDTTSPTQPSGTPKPKVVNPPKMYTNPQTTLMCQMLDITDPNAVFLGQSKIDLDSSTINPNEISLDDDLDDSRVSDDNVPDTSGYLSEQSFDAQDRSMLSLPKPVFDTSINPDEISLDGGDDEEEAAVSGISKMSGLSGLSPIKGSDLSDNIVSCDSQTDAVDSETSVFPHRSPAKVANVTVDSTHKPTTSSQTNTVTQEITSPQPKKFKRRNQALYTSTDE